MTEFPPPTGSPVTSSSAAASPTFAPRREPHPTLPIQVAGGAIVVLTASLLASKYLLDALITYEWPVVVYVTLLGIIGYGPSLVWARYATNRWGSGRFFHDVGLKPEFSDLGWGPVVWLAAIGTQIVMGAIVLGLGVPLETNTDGISELTGDRTYVISIVITAVIAAPFVEEIVFRGLVMRGLRSRMPAVPTIVLQAVLFGVAHVDPLRGTGNIGLVLVLSGVGAAFGGGAYLLRRIGPTIVAHAIFNGVVLVVVLTNAQEWLQNNS
jgi:membrane protease YdiL (CAAX protease family)